MILLNMPPSKKKKMGRDLVTSLYVLLRRARIQVCFALGFIEEYLGDLTTLGARFL